MQASLNTLHRWIFGNVTFSAREEYEAFRYKFLLVLMLTGAGFTALFVVGEYSKLNRIQDAHFVAMHLFTAGALLLWWLLRGHPGRFLMLAWMYESICLLEYTSSLWFVPTDELRLMWFYVNVPGVFMLLGPRAGWGIVLLSAAILLGSNAYMPVPYSHNAMATGLVALVYLGVFFHAFCARSMSYFTRMRDYNQQLEALASHDTLTGVLNARAYYQECERQVALARRMQQPYAVLFVDLDHFKRVNDERGHAAGDLVLKAVTQCMNASIRRTDVLGRNGGEEFSLFLPSTRRAGAVQLAEALRKAVEGCMPDIGTQRLKVTASIGVAVCDHTLLDMHAIQQQADTAMYVAKSLGRNRVSVFEDLQGISAVR